MAKGLITKPEDFGEIYRLIGDDPFRDSLPQTMQYALEKMTSEEVIQIVNEMVDTIPETVQAFLQIQMQMFIVFCLKQKDYGPTNIALGTRLDTEKEINAARLGVLVRTFDKLNRMIHLDLINRVEAVNESTLDAWEDTSVYAIIAQILQRGAWSK